MAHRGLEVAGIEGYLGLIEICPHAQVALVGVPVSVESYVDKRVGVYLNPVFNLCLGIEQGIVGEVAVGVEGRPVDTLEDSHGAVGLLLHYCVGLGEHTPLGRHAAR